MLNAEWTASVSAGPPSWPRASSGMCETKLARDRREVALYICLEPGRQIGVVKRGALGCGVLEQDLAVRYGPSRQRLSIRAAYDAVRSLAGSTRYVDLAALPAVAVSAAGAAAPTLPVSTAAALASRAVARAPVGTGSVAAPVSGTATTAVTVSVPAP